MIAILIAQKKLSFIHNDLHFDNVLICKCLQRTFMLYVFEYNSICYALLPLMVIIQSLLIMVFLFQKI